MLDSSIYTYRLISKFDKCSTNTSPQFDICVYKNLQLNNFHAIVGKNRKDLLRSQYTPANKTVQQNPTKKRNFQ